MRDQETPRTKPRNRPYFAYGPERDFDAYVERDVTLESYLAEEAPLSDEQEVSEETVTR